MSEPKNFLSRWSRRKLEPPERKAVEEAPAQAEGAAPVDAAKPEGEPRPEFDVSALPSLDSINATSDISAFLQAGVPSALRQAALRSAWAADPAIRDFVGLNENYWDAAGPEGVPGFGALDPNLDVKKLAAQVFGESEPEPTAAVESAADPADASANDPALPPSGADAELPAQVPSTQASADDRAGMMRCEENIASHQDDDEQQRNTVKARRHGSAKPQ